jgi:GcvH upstream region-like protein
MLQFFRKHQRFFFAFTTVVIVISFVFFGAFGAYTNTPEVSDQAIGKAIDGSDMSKREVEELTRFLSTGHEHGSLVGQGKMPNLLNDGVIKKDFLQTGMGEILAAKFIDQLKPELEERLQKIRRFSHYAHPQAGFINLEQIWKQFSPHLFQKVAFLREKCTAADTYFFSLLAQLSVQKDDLSSEMVRRILLFQQSQYSWLAPDESLYYANLNPFGFETVEDWLGRGYLELCSQFIINASKLAEKRGYSVSNKEVRAELVHNVQQGLELANPHVPISYEQARGYLENTLHSLGLDEQRALNLWKKVMLFRRLFQDVGGFALLDPLPFEVWGNYAGETVAVEQYELPESLRLRDVRTLLKFQHYLEGVAGNNLTATSFPKSFRSVQEVEKSHPELVQRKCKLEWKEVKKEELAQRITLKETWSWQAQDSGWQQLLTQFPNLAKETSKTAAGRLDFLDKLPSQERIKVDRFARLKMVQEHPEWVQEALTRAEPKSQEMGIRLKGGAFPFAVWTDRASFIKQLTQNPHLSIASPDQETLYEIFVKEIAGQNELVTFSQANQDGTLDELLDKQLAEHYPEIRKKSPEQYQLAQGNWKPLNEVKDQVAKELFQPLLKTLENEWKGAGYTTPKPPEFYAGLRLYSWMKEMRAKAIASPHDFPLLQAGDTFEEQWKLKKRETSIKRADKSPFAKEELFSLPEDSWSSVAVGEKGEISFCHLMRKKPDHTFSFEEKAQAKEAISREACRKLTVNLLGEMVEKNAIGMKVRQEN